MSTKPNSNEYKNLAGYFLTFTTYGTRLHGDEKGTVDFYNNTYGSDRLDKDKALKNIVSRRQVNPSVILNNKARQLVHQVITDVCHHRNWTLHAANVRTNHVHAVVTTNSSPERVLIDFKSRATRALTGANIVPQGTKVWTRHGSSRYLWNETQLTIACQYTEEGQEPDRFTRKQPTPPHLQKIKTATQHQSSDRKGARRHKRAT